MILEQQLQLIIDNAAAHDVPPVVIEKAIAPVLKLLAEQLHHLEYYILQTLTEDWVVTTIANPQSKSEKKVIYAFISVQDATTFQGKINPDLAAVPIQIVQLLFKLFSFAQVDSIIFLQDSQNLNRGVEIKRELLLQLITEQIKHLGQIPPDIA